MPTIEFSPADTTGQQPGKPTQQMVFAGWKHQPFNPSVQSEKIAITVK